MTGDTKIFEGDAGHGLKPYETPHLVHLDHRATHGGAPGATSDANETIINTNVTSDSAPS
jgi:hypothetical protein